MNQGGGAQPRLVGTNPSGEAVLEGCRRPAAENGLPAQRPLQDGGQRPGNCLPMGKYHPKTAPQIAQGHHRHQNLTDFPQPSQPARQGQSHQESGDETGTQGRHPSRSLQGLSHGVGLD